MKLTIVLTLKDRAPFTYRWMQYMNDVRCPYRILIADGGEDSAIEQHLRTHKHYPNLDYEYIRYPYDATIEDYHRKLENVISRVNSEYLLNADNDDFYLLERIPDILAFMDANKDYVGARGQIVNLALFRSGELSSSPDGERYEAVTNDVPSIERDSPYERIDALCSGMKRYDYYANWYSVFRASSFQKVWKALVTLPIREMIVMEMLTHVLMLMSGKIRIMPFPFYIRQSNTSMFGDTLVVDNEFLERCLINNSLSEFGVALDQFAEIETREERDRLLKAIAAWLEVFVVTIFESRAYCEARDAKLRRWNIIKGVPLFGSWITQIYYLTCHILSHIVPVLPSRKRNLVRLKPIEPHILARSKPY